MQVTLNTAVKMGFDITVFGTVTVYPKQDIVEVAYSATSLMDTDEVRIFKQVETLHGEPFWVNYVAVYKTPTSLYMIEFSHDWDESPEDALSDYHDTEATLKFYGRRGSLRQFGFDGAFYELGLKTPNIEKAEVSNYTTSNEAMKWHETQADYFVRCHGENREAVMLKVLKAIQNASLDDLRNAIDGHSDYFCNAWNSDSVQRAAVELAINKGWFDRTKLMGVYAQKLRIEKAIEAINSEVFN